MKHLNELNFLADKNAWKKKPLTLAMINAMSSDEADWHSRVNSEEFTKAMNPTRVQPVAPSIEEQQDFARQLFRDFPQLLATQENAAVIDSALAKMPNPTFTYSDFLQVYESEVISGRLTLNPSACGAGEETEVTGNQLRRYKNLWKLLEPVRERPGLMGQTPKEQKMSAKDYREAHKEDWRLDRIPDRQRADWNRQIAFFLESRPECPPTESNLQAIGNFITNNGLQINPQGLEAAFQALKSRGELELNDGNKQTGQFVQVTNLGGHEPGFPPKAEKYSFEKKHSSMSSKEYLDRINNDRQFREAMDGLSRA